MRRLFDRVTEQVREFLAGRDQLALIIRSPEGEVPAILQLLDTLEQETAHGLFFQFPEPFGDPAGYVATLLDSCSTKVELVRQLQRRENMDVWPELPDDVRDESVSPATQLRRLLVFVRSLIPRLQGSLLVWVMFPGDIADPAAYAGLMREVLQHEWPFPWCHHIRFVLRDDGVPPALEAGLSGIPRVAWLAPDLSTSAIERAFEEDINDESLPLEERVQSLLLTAGMDQSHQRYAAAQEKYHLLFQHYSTGGDLAMAAVALNGMGEVYRDQHDETGAGACFEAALVAASDGPHPSTPILLNVCLNLGNLRMQQQRWQEAEIYYDCAHKLATVLRYADVKVMILEQLGLAQSRQQKLDASRATWKAGAVVARQISRTDWETIHLQRLREQFTATGDALGLHDVEQQLAAAAPAEGA